MNPSSLSTHVSSTISEVWSKHLWLRPFLVLVLLAGVGWIMRAKVETTLKANLRSVLEATLRTERVALQTWMQMQRNQVEAVASDAEIERTIVSLVTDAKPDAAALELFHLPQSVKLKSELEPFLAAHKYNGYLVVEPSGRAVAASRSELIGWQLTEEEMKPIRQTAFAGRSMILPPTLSKFALPDRHGVVRVGVPTMFVIAPVRNESGIVVAVVGFRIQPEVEFTEILEIARIGETGETYAFNQNGLMLSNSRFDEQLRNLGLLPEGEDSTLKLSLKDPGIDMTTGARPKLPRSEQPLTYMAAEAIAGRDGVNVEGYRDYRGSRAVGAWIWLADEGFGIATELDARESHQTINTINYAFWTLFAFLGTTTLGMLITMRRADRLAEQARLNAIELKRLGQYTLEEKLGEGGMGVVYRGRHSMLHRPTAVKFLNADKTNEKSIQKFEREVQLTSQLNHPNTIAIYDYGRTPEGVFYYAMEYLDGINLEDIVAQFGPLPEGRVIYILKQVCGSLAEAHSIGLIHRDVKPANILLNARGGVFDFVKLLDFGLVKVAESANAALVTQAGGVVGTPLYMSPEAYASPDKIDARSDLYAVGAVGYFLLTGKTVFTGESVIDILKHQLETVPEPPSKRGDQPVSAEFERLVMRCLAKSPADRPASADEIIAVLEQLPTAGTWTNSDARHWWQETRLDLSKASSTSSTDYSPFSATIVVKQPS